MMTTVAPSLHRLLAAGAVAFLTLAAPAEAMLPPAGMPDSRPNAASAAPFDRGRAAADQRLAWGIPLGGGNELCFINCTRIGPGRPPQNRDHRDNSIRDHRGGSPCENIADHRDSDPRDHRTVTRGSDCGPTRDIGQQPRPGPFFVD